MNRLPVTAHIMNRIRQAIKRIYSVTETTLGTYEKDEFLHGVISYYDKDGTLVDKERSEATCRCPNFYEFYEDGDRCCEYGPHGLPDSITTRMGELVKVKRFQYGSDGGMVITDNHICCGDLESEQWREEYDHRGNLIQEVCDGNEFTREGHKSLDYEYDRSGRLVSAEGLLDDEYYTSRYRYNEQGQRIQKLSAITDWDYEGDNDMDESDEAPMRFEESEYQYRADGTLSKTDTYRCRACSLDAFLGGNYTRELLRTLDSTTEETVEGDRLVRTEKDYADGLLRAVRTHVYSHPDGTLLEVTDHSLDEETLTTIEYRYWDE